MLDALARARQADDAAQHRFGMAPRLGASRTGRYLATAVALALFAWFAVVFGRLALAEPEPDPEPRGFHGTSLKPPLEQHWPR
jgi:hypothetical protein